MAQIRSFNNKKETVIKTAQRNTGNIDSQRHKVKSGRI